MNHTADLHYIREALAEYRKNPAGFEERMATAPEIPLSETDIVVEFTDNELFAANRPLYAFVKAAYPSVRDFAEGRRRPASPQE